MKLIRSGFVLAAVLGTTSLLATPASAQAVENIGNQGQFVIGAERLTGLYFDKVHQEADGDEVDHSYTTISFLGNTPFDGVEYGLNPSNMPRLGADYLVTDGLSVGLSAYFITRSGEGESEGASSDGPSTRIFYLNPRVGYAYAFDDTFAIWPRAGLGWATMSAESGDGEREASISSTQLTIEGNVVVSPIEHFAIVGGPFLDVGLGGSVEVESGGDTVQEYDQKFTSFGLNVGIAAYF